MISPEKMDPRALALAQYMREKYGLQPSSSYRSAIQNKAAGGAPHSRHLDGSALDYSLRNFDEEMRKQILQDAYNQGARGIGVYGGDGHKVHFDFRDNFALWGNNPKHNYAGMGWAQAAPWAQTVLAQYHPKTLDGTTPGTQVAGTQTPIGGLLAGMGGAGTGFDADLLKGLLGGSKTQDPNAALLQAMMQPRQQPQERRPQPGELWAHWGQVPMQFDPAAIPLLKSLGA